jgi:hypothetical protein
MIEMAAGRRRPVVPRPGYPVAQQKGAANQPSILVQIVVV